MKKPINCPYCKQKIESLHKDHIIPKSRGGVDEEFNLIYCCSGCNMKKGDKDLLIVFSRDDLSQKVLDQYLYAKARCETKEYVVKNKKNLYEKIVRFTDLELIDFERMQDILERENGIRPSANQVINLAVEILYATLKER